MAHEHGHGHEHEHEHGHGHEHGHEHGEYGHGRLLFIDAPSGVAGDMLVAALVEVGVPVAALEEGLSGLGLSGYALEFGHKSLHAIRARTLQVRVHGKQPQRDYATIRALLESAKGLPEGARTIALSAFRLLAEAEAEVHGTSLERVHFHEVGAVDSIVDIVAAAIGFDYLGALVECSPLPLGRGFVRTQHGSLPCPAPATLLCLRGVPTYDAGIDGELVTPTGACLVRTVAERFTRWPSMKPGRVGWGAGTRELPDRPNAVRLVLGERDQPVAAARAGYTVLELNVDDMSGEIAAVALARAQEAGALDVWSTPIGMKKGRPALMLSALARSSDAGPVARALLSETSSLGLRLREVDRIERKRHLVQVETRFGCIAVKVAGDDGLPENVAPEYEDCRSAAEAHGVPVKQVYAEALAAYLTRGGKP